MVAPTTSWPCSSKSAAAIDESTPPDIATRTLTRSRAPQLRDGLRDRLERELDVGLGARPAERQPKRAQRPPAVDAHRLEHVRRLDGAAGARRARRRRYAHVVEQHEQRLGLDAVERHVRVA